MEPLTPTDKPKKKIIFYGVNYYPPRGGTSRVAENLLLQLKDKFDITIYCYKNEAAKDHIKGVKVVEMKPFSDGALGSLLYFFFSAVHILFTGKADLIHAHKTDCAVFIPLLKLRFRVVATSHEAPYKRDKWSRFEKAYFRIAERFFIRSPSICTCISEPLTTYYQEKYNRKVHFIPNGINPLKPNDFDYPKAASFVPAGASLDKPFLLFSARRLMATKGCHTLLQALAMLKYPGQVFIAGELNESKYLRQLKELSANLNVHFLGYVDPLPALLALVNRCELFIFPSETEGMSIMLLEVASVGKPIIASDIPENTQVFGEKEIIYFESGNAADLAQKIKAALADNRDVRAKGLKAQQKVSSDYLWSGIADAYAAIYNLEGNSYTEDSREKKGSEKIQLQKTTV
jgi:glycosyltransferase involved in cell wall biosynthesis